MRTSVERPPAEGRVERSEILPLLGPGRRQGEWFMAFCPAHPDGQKHGMRGGQSLGLSDAGVLRCFSGCSFASVMTALRERAGRPAAQVRRPDRADWPQAPIAAYEYRDPNTGVLIAVKGRFERPNPAGGKTEKTFRWRLPEGTYREGLGGMRMQDLPLWGAEEIVAADPDELVWIAEGEAATQALRDQGALAACGPWGASQRDFGRAFEVLRGRDVVLWPDNDPPGQEYMAAVRRHLDGVARSVRVVSPAVPHRGDAVEYFAAGGTVEALLNSDGTKTSPARVVRLVDVRAEKVSWLWRGYIPLGKVTLLDGDPGLGKSAMTLDLAARVSRGGPLPDGSDGDLAGPRGVVLLSAEDGLPDTILPRLKAAAAELSRISALEGVINLGGQEAPVELPVDIEAVRAAVRQVDAALVVIDPLMAYLSGATNSYRDQDVRRAMVPVKRLAEETGAAILVVRHLNKASGQSALYRGGGSIGIIGAARSGLLVGADPDDSTGTRRILAITKSNLSQKAPALAFHIEGVDDTCRTIWDGPTEHSAEMIVSALRPEAEGSALQEAMEFLEDALVDGEVQATKVIAAAHKLGISDITLRRARAKLRVRAAKRGFGDGTAWFLVPPTEDAHPRTEGAHGRSMSAFEDHERLRRSAPAAERVWCPGPGCLQIVDEGGACPSHQDLIGRAVADSSGR